MPQMAPLSWLILFIFFTTSLLLFTFTNYYLYSPLPPTSSSTHFKTTSLNWKW